MGVSNKMHIYNFLQHTVRTDAWNAEVTVSWRKFIEKCRI